MLGTSQSISAADAEETKIPVPGGTHMTKKARGATCN